MGCHEFERSTNIFWHSVQKILVGSVSEAVKYEAILSWFVTEFRKLSKQMGKSVSLKHSLIKTISFFGSTSQAIWSLDDRVELLPAELISEKELEDLLAEHIEILNPDWLLIGQQVRTVVGKYIDLLCMDHDGDLIVVELKKDLTPREVTAQAEPLPVKRTVKKYKVFPASSL